MRDVTLSNRPDLLIDWSSSQERILENFEKNRETGLATCYHGHYVVLQNIVALDSFSPPERPARKRVKFKVDENNHLLIPALNLRVEKYLIEPRFRYLLDLPMEIYHRFFPELKNMEFQSSRKDLSWLEICAMENRFYNDAVQKLMVEYAKTRDAALLPKEDSQVEVRTHEKKVHFPNKDRSTPSFESLSKNTISLFNEAQGFVKALLENLPEKPKILDLGSTAEPWFSYICAQHGVDVFAYDISSKASYEIEKEIGVTYISDDVNNIDEYSDLLSDLDLIFCRDMSPPQKLWNWYDPDYMNIWLTLTKLLKDDGVIYWEQAGSGTGIPDLGFMNHTPKYFKDFFSSLGLFATVTKFGYTSIKITKSKRAGEIWKAHELAFLSNRDRAAKSDLYASRDFGSLLKNYALQINYWMDSNDFSQDQVVEIRGDAISTRIIAEVISGVFRFYNFKLINESTDVRRPLLPTIKFENGPKFELSNLGHNQNSYFLVDENRDRIFTDGLMDTVRKYVDLT